MIQYEFCTISVIASIKNLLKYNLLSDYNRPTKKRKLKKDSNAKEKKLKKDVTQKFSDVQRSSSEASTSKTARPNFDIVIGKDEPECSVHPLRIYIGSGYGVEVKEFQKKYYICFSYVVNEDVKKRFNIPISQVHNLKLAIDTLTNHIKKKNQNV